MGKSKKQETKCPAIFSMNSARSKPGTGVAQDPEDLSSSRSGAEKYRRVQGLARGLDVLAALNMNDGGRATVSQLGKQTELHRTTVRRLLETLVDAGFVRYLPAANQYCLTLQTRALSSGFRDEGWISDIGGAPLRALTGRILWPSDIATLDQDEMIIRDSTHSLTSLSFHPSMVGRRLPVLSTAVGRAYLAFCPEDECAALLEMLRARQDRHGELARDLRSVRTMLDATRAAGHAFNEGAWIDAGRFNAIAVPVFHGKRVLACINIIFSKRSITAAEATSRFLAELQSTARDIEHRFQLARTAEGRPPG
jgi:IclR family mhp operon transcriptional activator